MRAVELYAGTGRSLEPFRERPWITECLLVDIDPHARATYLANHPNANYMLGDLARIQAEEIKEWAGGEVDLLFGCPPCQGYSDGGRRDPADPRNVHVIRFASLAVKLQPLAICMENVPGLASSPLFEEFCSKLAKAGYQFDCQIGNAATLGSCQTRQRLLLIAFRGDVSAKPSFPPPTHGTGRSYFSYSTGRYQKLPDDPVGLLGITPGAARARIPGGGDPNRTKLWGDMPIPVLGEVFAGLSDLEIEDAKALSHIPAPHTPEMLKIMQSVKPGKRWDGGRDHFSQAYGRLHLDGLARTITGSFSNSGSGRYWHPVENRALTLREAARIQGFEDDFRFLGPVSADRMLVGNALDGALARHCFRAVAEGLRLTGLDN